MKNPIDIVVVGGANWDYLVRGPSLPKPGESITAEEFAEAPGGKGANQAVAAARLGAKVAFIGCVGDDERGQRVATQLAQEGVDCMHLQRCKAQSTGVALVMVDCHGRKQIMVAPGANHSLPAAAIVRAREIIAQSKLVLMQFELPPAIIALVAQITRELGIPLAIDPAPPLAAVPAQLWQGLGLLRLNEAEAEAIAGVPVTNAASAEIALHKLFALGCQSVVIGAGSDGNLVASQGEPSMLLAPLRVASVDATGAGDAFMAALAVQRVEGQPLSRAARFANAAAALTTTKVGAQASLPFRHEVEAFLKGR